MLSAEVGVLLNFNYNQDETFLGCMSPEKIVIPDTVEKIGTAAFKKTPSNAKIKVPENINFVRNHIYKKSLSGRRNFLLLFLSFFFFCATFHAIIVVVLR